MSDLCEGRVCVVTGAARGIGRAHVDALVAAGARSFRVAGVYANLRPFLRHVRRSSMESCRQNGRRNGPSSRDRRS